MSETKVTGNEIDEGEWIAPSFSNSWVNYAGTYDTAGYFKDASGIVHIKGLVKNGTDGTTIFTLPAGYRPAAQHIFTVMSNNAAGRVDIAADGQVIPHATTTTPTWVSISGICFKADQ